MDLTIAEAFVLNLEERRRRLQALKEGKTLNQVVAREQEERFAKKLARSLAPALAETLNAPQSAETDEPLLRHTAVSAGGRPLKEEDHAEVREFIMESFAALAKRLDDLAWEVAKLRGQVLQFCEQLGGREEKLQAETSADSSAEAPGEEVDEKTEPAVSV